MEPITIDDVEFLELEVAGLREANGNWYRRTYKHVPRPMGQDSAHEHGRTPSTAKQFGCAGHLGDAFGGFEAKAAGVPASGEGMVDDAPAEDASAGDPAPEQFEEAPKFRGSRRGYVYKLGAYGLGYYHDSRPGERDKEAAGPASLHGTPHLHKGSNEDQSEVRITHDLSTGLHADGLQGRWRILIKYPEWQCYLRYLPGALSEEYTADCLQRIQALANWDSPAGIPRQTAWYVNKGCGCVYRYGHKAEVEVFPQQFPSWMEDLMAKVMPICGIPCRNSWPNSCNVNHYRRGQASVGWHRDDEALFQGRRQPIRIISLSLGQERTFQVQGLWNGAPVISQLLFDGDLCLMDGLMQKYFQHRVPKEPKLEGERINLTWRWVVLHQAECPSSEPARGAQSDGRPPQPASAEAQAGPAHGPA